MEIFKNSALLRDKIALFKSEGQTIGFVPTMGALHDGHISLVERSIAENSLTVVSIFVNPTQFTNPEDLENYPRTPEEDLKLLENKADIVFMPDTDDIYNDTLGHIELPDPGVLAEVMEGKSRPGHFKGVMEVVSRLFMIIQPDKAYFGEKDFQQVVVIRHMVEAMRLAVEIIPCKTIREASGLAMSSRNRLLNNEQKKSARMLNRALLHVARNWTRDDESRLVSEARKMIEQNAGCMTDYIEVVNEETLLPPVDDSSQPLRCFGAIKCGNIRLIDNVPVERS